MALQERPVEHSGNKRDMFPHTPDSFSRWTIVLLFFGWLSGCSSSDRSIVLDPLDWGAVDLIARAALDERFPQVDMNCIKADDFRIYTYELDHNGQPREEFIQSFKYRDQKSDSSSSIQCRVYVNGEVSVLGSRGFPFSPSGEGKFAPIHLPQSLKTPDSRRIDSLAKSAITDRVDPEVLIFTSLTVGYEAKSSTESYSIMYYDSSSVRTEIVEGRKTMRYTWVRLKLDKYGDVKGIMWHTPELSLEGRTEPYLATQPFPPATVPWPPKR